MVLKIPLKKLLTPRGKRGIYRNYYCIPESSTFSKQNKFAYIKQLRAFCLKKPRPQFSQHDLAQQHVLGFF